MFRYLAWSWDAATPDQEFNARRLREQLTAWAEWSEAYSTRGLCVHVTGLGSGSSRAYQLPHHTGVILGTLFRSSDSGSALAPPDFSPLDGTRITREGPGALAAHYWGRYVGFIRNTAHRTRCVFRDPTGGLPCWLIQHQSLTLYCSLMDDAAAIGVPAPAIDLSIVAASLAYQALEVETTAYQHVTQLLGGECLELGPCSQRRYFFWNPSGPIKYPPICAQGAEEALRVRTQDCVTAWASAYPALILTVSGGIDSTIVLACLRAQQQLRACLHHYSAGADSDERHYGRLSAHLSSAALLEYERIAHIDLAPLSRMHHFPLPPAPFYDLQHQQIETQVCAQFQAAAIFSGYGGDQLFGADPLLCAMSCAREHGLSTALLDVALDAAYVSNLSLWHILRTALRYRYNDCEGAPSYPIHRAKTLLMPHVAELLAPLKYRLTHPLIRGAADEDPATVHHLNALLVPPPFYGPFSTANHPDRAAPLLSQPLIELCIRLTKSLFISGGWDRSLARRAFQGLCPHDIMTRRDKGGVGERANTILETHRKWTLERLLEGQLVKERLVRRPELETILQGGLTRCKTTAVEVCEYLFTEAWLERSRAWSPTRMHS